MINDGISMENVTEIIPIVNCICGGTSFHLCKNKKWILCQKCEALACINSLYRGLKKMRRKGSEE